MALSLVLVLVLFLALLLANLLYIFVYLQKNYSSPLSIYGAAVRAASVRSRSRTIEVNFIFIFIPSTKYPMVWVSRPNLSS